MSADLPASEDRTGSADRTGSDGARDRGDKGAVVRRVLLALVYVLLVTPIGLLSRVTHDPLRRRWRRRAETYWVFPVRRG